MPCTITERADGFSVYPESRTVGIAHYEGDTVVYETVPFETVFPGWHPSLFDADYEGDNTWRVDLDCGAMRWRGCKSTREVRAALRKCGFDKPTIDRLVRKYRKVR